MKLLPLPITIVTTILYDFINYTDVFLLILLHANLFYIEFIFHTACLFTRILFLRNHNQCYHSIKVMVVMYNLYIK